MGLWFHGATVGPYRKQGKLVLGGPQMPPLPSGSGGTTCRKQSKLGKQGEPSKPSKPSKMDKLVRSSKQGKQGNPGKPINLGKLGKHGKLSELVKSFYAAPLVKPVAPSACAWEACMLRLKANESLVQAFTIFSCCWSGPFHYLFLLLEWPY